MPSREQSRSRGGPGVHDAGSAPEVEPPTGHAVGAETPDTDPAEHAGGGNGVLRDIVLVGVLALLAVIYLFSAFALPATSPNQADIGPRAYPLLVVALLVVVTGVLAATTVLRLRRRSKAGTDERAERTIRTDGSLWGSPLLRLALVAVATVVYLQLVIWFGFLIATAVYLAAEALIIGGLDRYRGRRLILPFGYGVAGSLAIFLLFDVALGVFLPTGMLGL